MQVPDYPTILIGTFEIHLLSNIYPKSQISFSEISGSLGPLPAFGVSKDLFLACVKG